MKDSKITLYNYVQRYVINKKFLENYPENKELLERKIKETENYILEMLERNKDSEILKHIV